MADLSRAITGLLTPGVIRRAAALVGESPGDTERALRSHVVPTVLSALATLASSERDGGRLRELLDDVPDDGRLLGDLGRVFAGGGATEDAMRDGRDQAHTLFRRRYDGVVAELAASGGLQHESASTLLDLTVPIVLAAIVRRRDEDGLDTAGVAKLLARERGGGGLTPGLRTLSRDVTPEPARPGRAPSIATASRWPIAAVAGVLLGLVGAWLLLRWGAGEGPVRPAPAPHRRLARLDLPSGAVEVPEGSFNHELARFLADPNAQPPRSFVFDGLFFESGRSTLEPQSNAVIETLAAILKAYPQSAVRLEGHTDAVGGAEANQRLSLERAEAVRAALRGAGVEVGRLDAVGFGQERPVASNDTEDGRAQNRRTELVVTRK